MLPNGQQNEPLSFGGCESKITSALTRGSSAAGTKSAVSTHTGKGRPSFLHCPTQVALALKLFHGQTSSFRKVALVLKGPNLRSHIKPPGPDRQVLIAVSHPSRPIDVAADQAERQGASGRRLEAADRRCRCIWRAGEIGAHPPCLSHRCCRRRLNRPAFPCSVWRHHLLLRGDC